MRNETIKNKMCEWKMCSNKATVTTPYKGELYNVCIAHRRLIRKQSEMNNDV